MLDLAIVGAGAMGANHARVAMGLRDARVSAVIDPDPERGRRVAESSGAKYLPDISGLPDIAHAAVLAAPTDLHCEMGVWLLERGIHTLVEKPITHDVGQAHAIIEAADRSGATLMVGHIERFNPAVMELARRIEEPIHFEASRISPWVQRIPQGVILDLMIHDLDIVAALAGAPVAHVEAIGTRIHSETEDLAVALLTFQNGVTAALTASRLGQQKIRRMAITGANAFFEVDLLRRDVTINRVQEVAFGPDQSGLRQTGMVEIPFLTNHGEPLFLELAHFVECVRTGSEPKVSGRDGLRALELALAVMKAAASA